MTESVPDPGLRQVGGRGISVRARARPSMSGSSGQAEPGLKSGRPGQIVHVLDVDHQLDRAAVVVTQGCWRLRSGGCRITVTR